MDRSKLVRLKNLQNYAHSIDVNSYVYKYKESIWDDYEHGRQIMFIETTNFRQNSK